MESSGSASSLGEVTAPRDLFLSYNGSDRNTVAAVRQALQLQNVATFYDREDLTPGQPWFDELEAALREVRSVAVFIGKEGMGTVQKREMQFALAWQAKEEKASRQFPVIPVLLEGADPEAVSGFLALNTWVDLRRGFEDTKALDPFLRALRREAAPPRQETAALICPYRSLRAFCEEHASLFFGREALSQKLLVHVLKHNLVTVIGPSGSGKSSVVQAGLLPLIRRQRPPEETWESVVFTPGSKPFHRLAAQLVQLWSQAGRDLTDIGTESEKLGTRLSSGEVSLANFVDLALKNLPNTSRLLAIVDQFEELFTQTLQEEQRKHFVDLLLTASRESKLTVVITLRADFYGRAIELRGLSESLESCIVNVREMSREDAKQAIEAPASRSGLEFEAGLIDRILDQVEQKSGALPLLEYALTELWRRRDGRRLTHTAYDAVGGVEGAISKRAEEQFDKLSPAQKQIALSVVARLVRISAANEDSSNTRQPAPLSDFRQDAQSILRLFAEKDARLVVTGRDETSGQETVTLAHEALIRSWDRLKRWVDHDREFLLWRQELHLFLTKWRSLTENKQSALLQGVYLTDAERWSRERTQDLNAEEMGFIEASQRPKMRSRRWSQFVAATALASVVALICWQWWTRRDAYQIQMILAAGSDLIGTVDSDLSGNDWLSALAYSGRSSEALVEGQRISNSEKRTRGLSSLAVALSKSGRTVELADATKNALSAYHIIESTDPSRELAAEAVAKALAIVGQTKEILAVAADIRDEPTRRRTFQSAARVFADAGKVVPIEDLVRGYGNTTALMGVSRGLAEAGQTGDALVVANRIDEPDLRVYALTQVSTALAHFGKTEEASKLATDVLRTAREVKKEPQLSYSLGWAALALAKAGRTVEAIAVGQQIIEPDSRDQAFVFIAEELARVDKAKEALAVANLVIQPSGRALAFGGVVRQMAAAGRGQQAANVLLQLQQQGIALYATLGTPVQLVYVVAPLAEKKPEEALAIALQIQDPGQRAVSVLGAAEALVHVGDLGGVGKPAVEALTWIRTEPNLSRRAEHLAKVMAILGRAGPRRAFLDASAEALRTAEIQDDDENKSEALSEIAEAYAKLHSYRRARLLADRCTRSDDRLAAYAAILREYTIQDRPESAKLFEDQPQYAPYW